MVLTKPKGLAIGAFERDNFGDTLFYYVLKQQLNDFQIQPASLLNTTLPNGEKVSRYAKNINDQQYKFIWLVGGEIGGLAIRQALGMSFNKAQNAQISEFTDSSWDMLANSLTGQNANSPAYLVAPSIKKSTPLIINSVGLSSLSTQLNTSLGEESVSILRRAKWVGVRDPQSLKLLEDLGIEGHLSPDIVHTLGEPAELNPNQISSSESFNISFQINEVLVQRWGYSAVAKLLVELSTEIDADISILAAGLAPGHDNLASLLNIAFIANNLLNKTKVTIQYSRDPLEISSKIAESNLWIGSSLHGRIIAASYGIPRVSLLNHKVKNYAEYWDSKFPSNIEIHSVFENAITSLSVPVTTRNQIAYTLKQFALENFDQAKKVIFNHE